MLKRTASTTTFLVIIWRVLSVAQDFVTFQGSAFAGSLHLKSRRRCARGGIGEGPYGLVLKGRARVAQDDGSQPESAVVIKILLPDSYLRTDTMGNAVKATGFQGSHLLTARQAAAVCARICGWTRSSSTPNCPGVTSRSPGESLHVS